MGGYLAGPTYTKLCEKVAFESQSVQDNLFDGVFFSREKMLLLPAMNVKGENYE